MKILDEKMNKNEEVSLVKYNKNQKDEYKKIVEDALKEKYINSLLMDKTFSEKKENMIMLLEKEEYIKRVNVFFGFMVYNIGKHFLWKKGYFASFFYITRMSSVALSLILVYLIRYEKELKIKKYGLNGYYNYYYKANNSVKEEKNELF